MKNRNFFKVVLPAFLFMGCCLLLGGPSLIAQDTSNGIHFASRKDNYIANLDCYHQCALTAESGCNYYQGWHEDCASSGDAPWSTVEIIDDED